jgi:hypothetical protein
VDLPEIGSGFKSKDAAAHLPCLVNEAFRCRSSSNTSPAGTT